MKSNTNQKKNIKTSPNQKIIQGMIKAPCDKDNKYFTVNLDCLISAVNELNYNDFKCWLYFSKNTENYQYALSTQDIHNTFGGDIKKLQSSINKLISLGYLVQNPNQGNIYTFNQWLQKETFEDSNGSKKKPPLPPKRNL